MFGSLDFGFRGIAMPNTLVQVPVIDFAAFRCGDEAEKQAVAQQIREASRDIGFMYLRNHGIPQALIARTFNHAQNFFDLPLSDKVKLAWSDETNYLLKSGYIAPEREGLDVDKSGDLKEVLDVGKDVMNTWNLSPEQEQFRQTTQEFYQACTQTVNQILSVFAIALGLLESFFADKHDHDDHELRFLHYPPVTLKVEWTEEIAWGTMIEGLLADRYDVAGTPVWDIPSRGKIVGFSIPLYYSGIGAYVRQNDNRFDGKLDSLNSKDVKIATIDGEMAKVIANSQFPDAQHVSLAQISDVSQMLLNVIESC